MRKKRFISLILSAVIALTLFSGTSMTAKAATTSNSSSLDVAREGGTATVVIFSQGLPWVVSNNTGAQWITAKKENNNTLKLVIKENDGAKTRTGTVGVTIGDKSKGQKVTMCSIKVTQAPNYHIMTLYAGEGSFNGKTVLICKVKHGTKIGDALIINVKEIPKANKTGYRYALFTDEKDPATRTKSESYIRNLYERKIETDINLYATYAKITDRAYLLAQHIQNVWKIGLEKKK